jgi:hypothetical protein
MFRVAITFCMMLFVMSYGGVGGTANHEHRDRHIHGTMTVHQHDDGSQTGDQTETLAYHSHLLADRTPGGHIVTPPLRDRAMPVPAIHRALASLSSAPPLQPPERA